MAEKMYKVLDDQKYTGKHRVYYGKGSMGRTKADVFKESELFGNDDNHKMALEGAKDTIKKDQEGREYVAIRGKEPKIRMIEALKKKGKK